MKINTNINKYGFRDFDPKHHIDTVLEELIDHAYNKRPKAEDFIPHTYSPIRTAAKYHTEGEDLPTNIGSDVYILVQKLIK